MALDGIWWNELGSKMVVQLDPGDPLAISGTYHTNVGNAQERQFPLVGRCGTAGDDGQVVGWVVVWDPPDPAGPGRPPNQPSITSWAGQLHTDPETDEEFIATSWLLNRTTAVIDDWESTLVGFDYFVRTQPTPGLLQKVQRVGKAARYLK